MTPEKWKQIEDIFQDALDLSGEERKKFIAEKSGDDGELRAEVEKLIARFETEEEFLESPVWTDSAVFGDTLKSRVASSLEREMFADPSEKSLKGKKIGVYVLTAQIGKGGMGTVYAAQRADGEFSQKAAVKFIKRGIDTDFTVRRFRNERQILANLNHPNIARLYDGGTTDDGLPYFIMEYIEGKPFPKYCKEKNLGLREKLELFLQICGAVAYAHNRKIIHRDIKPSNILVTGEGVPKLLDFGIAKILDPDQLHESLAPTATQMRLMTPEYASPEQIIGEEITPASDQYSLGVLLYELITGARPYKFASRSPHEIARVICEEIPSEPSSGDFGKTFAEQENDFKLDKDACEKLDRIVLKTLRKDRSERYASVEDFAEDIRRFLNNRAIRAESFAETLDGFLYESGENQIQKETGIETNEINPVVPAEVPALSPRRKGLKQGAFVIILSFVTLPIFFILTLAGGLHPAFFLFVFLLLFLGGATRIIYALLFEPKTAAVSLPAPKENRIETAETKLISREPSFEKGKRLAAKKSSSEEKSIAVLPFTNLNTSDEIASTNSNEFLGIGLADALITRLSNVRQFIVRPTSSVLKFGAPDTDSVTAGKELGVRYVVEGKIMRTEKRIRVSVLLSDVEKHSTVWAERFDENFTDVLEIEDLISAKIIESLLPKLKGEQRRQLTKRATDNPQAYEAYLRGRFHWNSFTEDSFVKASDAYTEAIEKDQTYALAYAGIADYYIWLGVYGIVAPKDCYPHAKQAAERAIAIDDRLAEAYAALGFAQLCGEFDWENAEKNCLRAIEINPHYTLARLWYSFVLQSAGRFDEGIEQAKKAVELDPLTYMNYHVLAWAYYFARRFDEAVLQAEKTIKKFPLIGLGKFNLNWYLRHLGKTEDALAASEDALELSGKSLFVLLGHAQTLASAGKNEETETALQEIFEQGKRQYLSFYQLALVYVYQNKKQKALDALEHAFDDREGWLIWLKTEPALDPLRREARFQNLLEKINPPR